jgi:hypothetical protein
MLCKMDTGKDARRALQWMVLPEPERATLLSRWRGVSSLQDRFACASNLLMWEGLLADGVTYQDLMACPFELVLAKVRTGSGGCVGWRELLQLRPALSPEEFESGPWGRGRAPAWAPALLRVPAAAAPVTPAAAPGSARQPPLPHLTIGPIKL